MMPFSVLRIWGLGIVGWALLAGGIYCGWRAYEEFRREPPPVVVERRPATEESPDDPARPAEERHVVEVRRPDRTPAWAFLAASIALLGISGGGFLPVRWLLGNATGPERDPATPQRELWVDRPDGSRLHVQIYGSETAPTLLLTHGWSLDISAWDYVIGKLSQRCRVVAWDLAGLGGSRAPTNNDHSLEKMAYDLHAVLQATSNGRPVVLGSHSIGGMITQTYCQMYRQHLGSSVHGIALLHTTYINPLRTCFLSSLATALEWPLITPLNYLTIALAPLAWLSNWQGYLNGSLHLSTRISTFSGKQTRQQLDHAALLAAKAWPGVLARGNLAMQQFHGEPVLDEIELPVLVIGGEHDRMTLPSASSHMEELLPADRPHRLPSGHLGMWECPDRFVEVVSEFVEHVAATASKKALRSRNAADSPTLLRSQRKGI